MLKFVVDENITFGEEAFSNLGEVELLHGRKISNNNLKDADGLIIRSITNVNKELLDNTQVKFVGTATIGTDHIDIDYLNSKGIKFADAKGCNSDAVAEYVFTSLFYIANENNIKLKDKTIGIIGCGNIGSRIEKISKAYGLKVVINDPPLERRTKKDNFVSLDEVLKSDIITLHVPLINGGEFNTNHLLNINNINLINENSILINTSRGNVIDNKYLNQYLSETKLFTVLDVWENEPNINCSLLEKIDVPTPHIAGYSFEGKINGTKMIYDAATLYFKINKEWKPKFTQPEENIINMKKYLSDEELIAQILTSIYPIYNDILSMEKVLSINSDERGEYFDKLRKEYPLRREFNNYVLSGLKFNSNMIGFIKSLRFQI